MVLFFKGPKAEGKECRVQNAECRIREKGKNAERRMQNAELGKRGKGRGDSQ